MIKYDSFNYIYPQRPTNSINPKDLPIWEKQKNMFAQLKFNGSNTLIFTNGEQIRVMGRHNQILSNFNISREEIIDNLYKPTGLSGKWLVLNGETLNKSKKDEMSQTFNQKLIIFDILVYDSNHLLGVTNLERVNLLYDIFNQKPSEKEYLWGISQNVFLAKHHFDGFSELFDMYTKIDFIEGLVLKRINAKMEIATESTNNKSQIKSRKSCKNYKY